LTFHESTVLLRDLYRQLRLLVVYSTRRTVFTRESGESGPGRVPPSARVTGEE